MKKLAVILFMSLSIGSYASSDLDAIKSLTLQGYKAIRHDALGRLKFRKVHEMNKLIKNFK